MKLRTAILAIAFGWAASAPAFSQSTLTFDAGSYTVVEGGPNVLVTVTRTGDLSGTVSVFWNTINGTATSGYHFGVVGLTAPWSGSLTFGPGVASQSFSMGRTANLPIIDDLFAGTLSEFTVALDSPIGNATLGALPTTSVTIIDNDFEVAISPSEVTVGETGANTILVVTRTGQTNLPAIVDWQAVNGSLGAVADQDYAAEFGTFFWAAGDTSSRLITIGSTPTPGAHILINNDPEVEAFERFQVRLSSISAGAVIGDSALATVTIESDEPAVGMGEDMESVGEAEGTVIVTVHRFGSPAAGTVSVQYATQDSSAQAGIDYTAVNGTFTWADGDASPRNIVVPLIADAVLEGPRTFSVRLMNAVGAPLVRELTTVEIIDDDVVLTVSATQVNVLPGATDASFTVARSGLMGQAISLPWSTANGTAVSGTDFGEAGVALPVSGLLSWGPFDATPKTVAIPILGDPGAGSLRSFAVSLGPASLPTATVVPASSVAVMLAGDSPILAFDAALQALPENGAVRNVLVNRTGRIDTAVGVGWTTASFTAHPGENYGAPGVSSELSGTLSWGAGDAAPKVITVGEGADIPTLEDGNAFGPSLFRIVLSNATGGAFVGSQSFTEVQIDDDDSFVGFQSPGARLTENGPNVDYTITRTGGDGRAISINWSTVDDTARAGEDFGTLGSAAPVTGTISWGVGDFAPKTISIGPNPVAGPWIPTIDDGALEATEFFRIRLTVTTPGAYPLVQDVPVVLDSEEQSFSLAASSNPVFESLGPATILVGRLGLPVGPLSVDFATVQGTAQAGVHFQPQSGTLTWASEDTAPKVITVVLNDDALPNDSRSFSLVLSNPTAGALLPAPLEIVIRNDDLGVRLDTASYIVLEGSPVVSLTASLLGGPAFSTVSANFATTNGTAVAGQDFGSQGVSQPVTGAVSWLSGETGTRVIQVPILDDLVNKGARIFTVSLTSVSPAGFGTVSLGSPSSAIVQILENDPSIRFSQAIYVVKEGGPAVAVQVLRPGILTLPASVTWTTANGTAIAGQDFGSTGVPTQRTGTLSWAAGDGQPKSLSVGPGLVSIPILADNVLEGDESFTITLSNPTGAVLGANSVATIQITDDESLVSFAPATATVGETGANTTLTVTRTGSLSAAASVTWTTVNGTALAGSDFGAGGNLAQRTGLLSWAAGDGAPKTISVGPTAAHIPVLNDAAIESPETFTVVLSAPTGGAILGAAPVATVTITSEDAGIAMATATQSVAEGVGSATVIVNRVGATTGAVSVNYATANGSAFVGTHYTATSGTLNWAAGDGASKTITVPVVDTPAVNPNRTFNVTLSGPVGAVLGTPITTVVTIADDDNTLQFTAPTATVAEGTASLVLTVSRLGGAAGAASVTWTTANATALSGTDFGTAGVPADFTGTLSWAAGDLASKTITIPILNDALVEAAKTFTVALASPTGLGTSIGTVPMVTVTLNDNDAGVVFSSASYLVNENTASITLRVNRIGPTTAAASVTWTTANASATSGADFGIAGNATNRTGALSWAAGDSAAKTFVIPILNDALAEGLETFTVTLSNPSAGIVLGTPATTTVTILDDESPPLSTLQFSAPKTVVVEGSGPAVLSVTRTGSDFNYPVSVNFAMAAGTALSGADYTASTGILSWTAGDSAPKTISVPITNDAIAENPEQFTVVISAATPGAGLGTPATATVTVIDDDELFPLDGVIPPGWGIPGGAAGGWHVSNDPGPFDGVFSLRSDLIDDSEAAQIEVTGNYQAGTVTFRVKISSEPNFDFLRFYIDGVQKGQWSGTANGAWQLFSVAVPAGTHTFRWSYEKDGSESFGFDAAWIDAVVLPAVQ